MPFQMIETQPSNKKRPMVSVSYKRASRKGEKVKGSRPGLVISVPKVVAPKFTPDERSYVLHIGTGADVGKARIIEADAGGTSPTTLKHSYQFRFGFVPYLGDEAAEAEHCEARWVDLAIEIDLPEWFKGDGPIKPAAASKAKPKNK